MACKPANTPIQFISPALTRLWQLYSNYYYLTSHLDSLPVLSNLQKFLELGSESWLGRHLTIMNKPLFMMGLKP